MTTDTSERGLERLICKALTGSACDPGAGPVHCVRDAAARLPEEDPLRDFASSREPDPYEPQPFDDTDAVPEEAEE